MLVLRKKSDLPTMENFVNDFFGKNPFTWDYNFDFAPKARIKENDDDYTLSLGLPGFKKEDVNINIEDDVLIISSTVEKDDFKSSFENRYSIPEDVDTDKVEATMENGVLKVVVGKYKELPKTNVKKIDIK
jgi:HSP20 family protein